MGNSVLISLAKMLNNLASHLLLIILLVTYFSGTRFQHFVMNQDMLTQMFLSASTDSGMPAYGAPPDAGRAGQAVQAHPTAQAAGPFPAQQGLEWTGGYKKNG